VNGSAVRHHMAIFDLAHRLPTNADEVAQLRLRHPAFATQALEAAGNFAFIVRPPCAEFHIVPYNFYRVHSD
jgi:hypothetical protein